MTVTTEDARRVGTQLAVNWTVVPVNTFRQALLTELEHTDVTNGDLLATGKIALAHLREDPDYYTRLARVEDEASAYWATRNKPSPTLGGCVPKQKMVIIAILVLAVLLVAYITIQYVRQCSRDPQISTFVPGDPNRNILRRSRPYPPGRYAGLENDLSSYYFQYDPARLSGVEHDYCWHAPGACKGFNLDP